MGLLKFLIPLAIRPLLRVRGEIYKNCPLLLPLNNDFGIIWKHCESFRISALRHTDEMRRQSNRYSCNTVSMQQPEQQITQYLIEHPLINAILDDDEDKVF